MGWLEDSLDEFRKLPTAGKVAMGAAAAGVVLLAIAQARSSASSAGVSGASALPPDALAGSGAASSLPSLSSGSPADWANWFSNGLTTPNLPAPPSTPPLSTPSLAAVASSFTAAASSVSASASAPAAPKPAAPKPAAASALAPYYPIQNPTVAQTAAHRGTLAPSIPGFIPTTIRPLPTPGRGRVA